MIIRLPIVLLAAGLALLPDSQSRAEVRVDGSLDPQTVEVGQSAVLTITIEGAGSMEGDPRLVAPDGIRTRDAGESRSFSLVNGKFTQSIQRQILIVALRPGTYTLGPVEVRASGRAYPIGPFTLTAIQASGAPIPVPPAQRQPGPGQRSLMPPGASSGGDASPSGAPPVAVEMRADPAEVYVGQQTTLHIAFLRRAEVPVVDARFNPPATEGFWKEDLPPERQGTRMRGEVSYAATEILIALFPTRSGDLQVLPASVDVRYRDPRDRQPRDPFGFFGIGGRMREASPASGVVSIHALPLPAGAPSSFTGAVGRFTIDASLDRPDAVQGEPITWTLSVEGEGNVSSIEGPPFPEIPGCRGYDAGNEVKTTKSQDRIGGKKRFSRVLVPEAAGTLEFPRIAWAFFDPEGARYRTLEIPARRINVAPSKSAGADGSAGRLGGAIRGNRRNGRLVSMASERPWSRPAFWILQTIPVAALVAGFLFKRRREEILKDPGGARMRQAPRKLRLALAAVEADRIDPWGRLSRALEDFLADRYGPEIRGMTRPGLAAYLAARGVPASTGDRLSGLLEKSDTLRYAPGSASAQEEVARGVLEAADCAGNIVGRPRA